MKRLLILIALFAAPLYAMAGPAVGVSVGIGQPGFYGQLDLGTAPPPPLIYGKPIVIQPVPVGVIYPPIYLHVPPSHYRNWRFYCGRYNACGRPVYFVNDGWYRNTYVPYYHRRYPDRYPNDYYYDRHHRKHYYNENGHR